MLPNQANNKVDETLFVHSNTYINYKVTSNDQHNSNEHHAVDAYANPFYENENEIGNECYEYIPALKGYR